MASSSSVKELLWDIGSAICTSCGVGKEPSVDRLLDYLCQCDDQIACLGTKTRRGVPSMIHALTQAQDRDGKSLRIYAEIIVTEHS